MSPHDKKEKPEVYGGVPYVLPGTSLEITHTSHNKKADIIDVNPRTSPSKPVDNFEHLRYNNVTGVDDIQSDPDETFL